MAGNENRRRKKIEAQRAKRKEQQRAVARVESSGVIAKMVAAKSWPIFQSRVTPGFGFQGMASVALSRRGPYDQVAAVIFLVDTFCLGVKDVAFFTGADGEWKKYFSGYQERTELDEASPESLRKFVEGAVAFAKTYGIAPHRDYSRMLPIFGDLDVSQCAQEFTYGYEGKPHFIPGPNDRPERVRQILNLLGENAGADQFHFTLPIDGDAAFSEVDDDTIELLDAD